MSTINQLKDKLNTKYSTEKEYLQATTEVLDSLSEFIEANPEYNQLSLLERLVEPERSLIFRIPWVDDKGNVQVNTGYRVQFNSALGPYKGGLRFHPSVNLSILKFLGFEQIFKNSLTSLPLGGGKGGSDFDPKGKSDNEIMRFTQAFMNELYTFVGPDLDVPAGDIGVGGKEIGYLFGQYKKLTKNHVGVLTGKGVGWGGSQIRTEATGYGLIYFVENILSEINQDFEDKTVAISGSGNVAQYASEKAIYKGAKVISLSDSSGFVHIPEGLSTEQLEYVKVLKNNRGGRISEFATEYKLNYFEGKKPWILDDIQIALPCATQNEIEMEDAKLLVQNGVEIIGEGANMPTTNEALEYFQANNVIVAPAKAANAGGVGVSGLEMAQNSQRIYWSSSEVDEKLCLMMQDIHDQTKEFGKQKDGSIDYVSGANIAGFVRVAKAMLDQGVV